MIYQNLSEWQGYRVEDHAVGAAPADPARVAYRLRVDWDSEHSVLDLIADLATSGGASRIEALVIGAWQGDDSSAGSDDIIQALAAARGRLANLRHLFFGDIIGEENEISWIEQGDVSPLLTAYPALETFTIHGGTGLSFGRPSHAALKTLHVQAGGLPASVLHELADADLPALEDLEVWLGEENYGGDATAEDVAALLVPDRFPKLRRLAVKNSPIQDEVAGLIAASPILRQIEHLDVGMGALTDEGAEALLKGDLSNLKSLRLDHHFVGEAMVDRLRAAVPVVSAEGRQEEDEWNGQVHRYIAVSE